MNCHSETTSERLIRLRLENIRASAFFSESDGCRVTLVPCHKCGKSFQEELGTAEAKVISDAKFLCIACDVEAEKPAEITAVQLPIWFYI